MASADAVFAAPGGIVRPGAGGVALAAAGGQPKTSFPGSVAGCVLSPWRSSMNGWKAIGLVWSLTLVPAAAQEPAGTGFPVVKVPVRSIAKLPPALTYALLPEPGEMKAGNAAPMWLRAGRLAAEIKPPF